ncbi:hypothetical protein CASFOL_026389 [Castilleja foliolosa]|uniref:Uncharacterized protein n=1 Tax=Castilleja foliolosa TaxID=1961234 RepID=A0ABD3CI57_9LAMI
MTILPFPFRTTQAHGLSHFALYIFTTLNPTLSKNPNLSTKNPRSADFKFLRRTRIIFEDWKKENEESAIEYNDVDIQFEEQWLCRRNERNDLVILSSFKEFLSKTQDLKLQNQSNSNGLKAVTL